MPVLPLIGDTDNIFYFHIPDTNPIKSQVYSDYGEIFFDNRQATPQSFLEGGYYRRDLIGKLSIIALNSLHWNSVNAFGVGPGKDAQKQMDWFER